MTIKVKGNTLVLIEGAVTQVLNPTRRCFTSVNGRELVENIPYYPPSARSFINIVSL